jgi:hypothetical protein
MKGQSANEELRQLFEGHSMEVVEKDGWLFPNYKLPAIRATWYPNNEHLSRLLQVEVFLEKGQVMEESFAGLPNKHGKLNDAFENFSRNSFHVMLSALWEKHDSEQVSKELWCIGSGNYHIYIGPFGQRGGKGLDALTPMNAFEQIEKAIKTSKLTNKYHWFRIFFCNTGKEEQIYEALKDNENWHEGLQAIKSVDWKEHNQYYSSRNFIIAIKEM